MSPLGHISLEVDYYLAFKRCGLPLKHLRKLFKQHSGLWLLLCQINLFCQTHLFAIFQIIPKHKITHIFVGIRLMVENFPLSKTSTMPCFINHFNSSTSLLFMSQQCHIWWGGGQRSWSGFTQHEPILAMGLKIDYLHLNPT